MCVEMYFTRISEKTALIKCHLIFMFLVCFPFLVNLTKIVFFLVNEENQISNLDISHSLLEKDILCTDFIYPMNEEDKFSVFKNNIICFQSISEQPKYFIPKIVTIPYNKNALLQSNVLKKNYECNRTDIRIILKDVSYQSLHIFLKSIEHSEIIVNKLRIQDFLDILIIISLLDIENNKKLSDFIKELFINDIFSMENETIPFNFEKYYDSPHFEKINKSMLMNLWILFMNIITFNDKATVRTTVRSELYTMSFKFIDVLFSSKVLPPKSLGTKLYLRLDKTSITHIYKIINVEYLMRTWIFLLKISNLDILYLIFLDQESYEKSVKLFSNITCKIEKIYMVFLESSIKLFSNINFYIPCKSLKVFKLKYDYFTTDEIKMLLKICDPLQYITIKTKKLDFKKLNLLVDFFKKNPDKFCKIKCSIYDILNTDSESLSQIPTNIIFYIDQIKTGSSYEKIPIKYMPFFHKQHYCYKLKDNDVFPNNIVFYECSKFIEITLDFTGSSVPFKLNSSIFTSMRYFKTIKYFFLENIIISDELLLYVLESNTILLLVVQKFCIASNLKFHSRNDKLINQSVNNIVLKNSLSNINCSVFDYLSRFRHCIGFKLVNVYVDYRVSCLKNLYNFFLSSSTIEYDKIYMEAFVFETEINDDRNTSFLQFFSIIYDFSKLYKISYRVYRISETEFRFFSEMRCLKNVHIEIRNRTDCIDFQRLFCNFGIERTILHFDISVYRIHKNTIEFFKKIKNLMILRIFTQTIDIDIIKTIKKNDFRKTFIRFKQPTREHRLSK
ncbi:hypothetical protein CWI36_0230p0010 [Hamiltosporidium magnivora]|uniref:Uncharacterized protein n=1 Tax=Hamiltosporidium magnivora TaxID=148818 RepID=A0A4Q9LIG1_9MICR|nr:hypothetical protein CWI36_0230p0010 [Hamiltosporidium magnivora]